MNKLLIVIVCCMGLASCKVYSFKNVSIPPEVKTIKINSFENKARYYNPQLSPQLADKLRQKINNQTRLTEVLGDDANYEVSGTVTNYDLSTAAVSNQQAASNRLTVTVHIVFVNHMDPTGKKVAPANFEADITQPFDFDASKSLDQAQSDLMPTILTNITDAIFNRLFSNW